MMKTTWLGSQRIDLESCSSTNDEAARLARAGASHGTVVIAECQTAGRGRDGRIWRSPPGGLYLSAVVRPPLALAMVPPMTLAIGIGTCDAVRACGVGGVLKWPNDILVDGDQHVLSARPRDADHNPPSLEWRKLAGVLVEAQSQGGRLDAVIVGIGINVRHVGLASPIEDARARAHPSTSPPNPSSGFTSPSLSAISTSLEREVGEPIDREIVIGRLLGHVERWIDRYVAIGLPAVIPAWHERMAHGLIARATIDGEMVIGEVAGLDPEGALMLRDTGGKVRRVRSGDVEVIRPAASGSGPVVDPAPSPTAC